jgi:hypothetical protein
MNYKNIKYIFLIGLIVFISINTYFNKKQNLQSLQQAARIEKTTIVDNKSSLVKPEKKGIKKNIKKSSTKIHQENFVQVITGGIEDAFLQEFNKTMNLKLKRPTPEVLPEIIEQNFVKAQSQKISYAIPGSSSSASWVELGPANVGGRTRAITWDPNDPTGKKVWAGGVSGGLWYNNDITNVNSSWNKVNDFWQTLSISKIIFDTINKKTAYVSTGEGFGTRAGIGAGIWKTTDGGINWDKLTATNGFLYSNDMVIRTENNKSVIYAAIDANIYMGKLSNTTNVGLYRSTDNGVSWTQTLPVIDTANTAKVPFAPASIQISKNNKIWVGTKASPNPNNNQGGGYILSSTNGTDWTVVKRFTVRNGYGRVSIAVAPSNANVIYAFVENNNKLENLYRSDDEGLTWVTLAKPKDFDTGIPADDFTRGQAWYDQAISVDPNNPNTVIVGGIDLFKSTDGGTTWNQISKWYNWNAKYSYVHADQHAILYKPNSSSTALFANDGGVFYTSNLTATDTANVISHASKGYNVTQFYAGAIHPEIGKNFFLAGSQDNGTQRFTNPTFSNTTTATGGDGGFCFIDQTNPKFQITSYTRNSYTLSSDSGKSFTRTLIDNDDIGSFINPATYDNNLHILYSNSSSDYLVRLKNITNTPKLDYVSVPNLKFPVTALKVSPYNELSTTIFLGTSNGELLKVINADSTPSTTLIGGTSFPKGSISCIELGSSENEIVVTFFNYGSKKIWYTNDGGKTWLDKAGDFPDIPVRWALFNPNKTPNQLILATELGIYATNNFSNTSPTWTQSNNGFANVRTDMLQLRNSDFNVIAATHGRGLYISNAFSEAKPPIMNSFSPKIGPSGSKITIKGLNFLNATEVRFGGLPAKSFTVESDTIINAIVGLAFPGYVSVKTGGGIASLPGFSSNPPKITSFVPASGGNGIPITINGSNLSEITSIVIGGKLVKNFTIESNNRITAVIPDSTVNGKIVIQNDAYADSLAGFTTCSTPSIINGVDTTFCVGNVYQLRSSVAPEYQWFNAGNRISNAISQSLSVNASGNYQVRTTNNNCQALSSIIKIVVNPLPVIPTVRDTFYCNNINVDSLKASVLTNHSLIWYTSDSLGSKGNNISIVPNTSKVGVVNYFVSQINNSTKCESPLAKFNITINPIPNSPIVRDSSYCQFNTNAKLSVTNITGHDLLWYGTNATGGTGTKTTLLASTIDTATKNYFVSQMNVSTGCESPRVKLIAKITAAPSIPTIKDVSYCFNSPTDTLKAIASDAHTINWYDKEALGLKLSLAPIPNALKIGQENYYVSQTSNTTSCESLRGKLSVTINALPIKLVIKDTFYCQNTVLSDSLKPILLNAHAALWYQSDSLGAVSSSTAPKIQTNLIGFKNYFVSQKNNSTGCEGDKSKFTVEIRSNPTTPTLYRDTTNFLVSNYASNNIWYKDGSLLPDTAQRIKPTVSGSFTLKTSQLGCTSPLSTPYYYLVTNLYDLGNSEFIKLAPNPFVYKVSLDFYLKKYNKLNIEVFSLSSGQKIDAKLNIETGTALQLNDLPAGTYLFRVSSFDNKLVKQFKFLKL